jgi:signal transduction histidine kinase
VAESLDSRSLDAVLRWFASGCSTRTLARDIERATSRILQLVSSIKRFTYMDRANVPEPVDLGQLLSDTIIVLGSKARHKSVALRLDIQPDLPKVSGFGGELNQVWMNLIDNAIDAAPTDGSVEVCARQEHAFIVVRVIDNGPGIPEEIRAKIFDPFFTTKPPGQGTGLGLDIVQRVVRHHRAELNVMSRPGRTEFRVGLPLDDAGAHPTPAAEGSGQSV